MEANEAAKIVYTKYCNQVGGKAFNGDALPDWESFAADPNKQVQAQAWRNAAGTLVDAAQLEVWDVVGAQSMVDKARVLCSHIEALPASDEQTVVSLVASELLRQLTDLID